MKRILIWVCVWVFFTFIFCVATPLAFAELHDNGNGTVSDTVTGLMWQQGDVQNDGGGRTWEEALAYCQSLELAGYTVWRLPNVRELETILDLGQYSPAIDTGYFPACRSSFYWSSSTNVHLPNRAWYADFSTGEEGYSPKDSSFSVRCVMDAPTPCPECTGDPVELQNVTFEAGTDCECAATTSITIGNQVIIENGATVVFKAPTIKVQPGFHAETGAVVKMRQP